MKSSIPHLATLSEASFLDFWAYGMIAICAYLLYHLDTRKLVASITGITVGLIATIILCKGFVPNTYKYPPEHQYMLWGLLVVAISFLITRFYKVQHLPSFLIFVSANSMWVYFWHLIPVNMIKYYPQFFPDYFIGQWWLKWLCIIIFASFMTYIQNYIKNYITTLKVRK